MAYTTVLKNTLYVRKNAAMLILATGFHYRPDTLKKHFFIRHLVPKDLPADHRDGSDPGAAHVDI